MNDHDEEVVRDLVLSRYEECIREHRPGIAPRDQHAESIGGLIMGQITIADVPLKLRHGTFDHPIGQSMTYPVRIRYSPSSPIKRPDRARDAIGMAIKILLPDDREHDIILADYPVFFCRDAADMRELIEKSQSVTKPSLSFFFPRAIPWKWRIRELWNMVRSARLKQRVVNPFQKTYYSQAAYACGTFVVKYIVRPSIKQDRHRPSKLVDGFREHEMTLQLQQGSVTLDLLVQPQGAGMPEDDLTIRWDEKVSPPQKVATITIPRQDFQTDEMLRAAEDISFNPFNTPPEHVPLGSIGRARALAYDAISRRRHELNRP